MITSAAILNDLLALCSPSAAITLFHKIKIQILFFVNVTFALASLAASASAAIARISCSGTLTSFT